MYAVLLGMLVGCSDDPACVDRYRAGYNATLTLVQSCPFQGRRLLDVLDHPDAANADRKGSAARARTADVSRDPTDATDHDCNVQAMLLREQIADSCP